MGKNELPLAPPSGCGRQRTDGTVTDQYGDERNDVRQK
jgi:hypothetical protein